MLYLKDGLNLTAFIFTFIPEHNLDDLENLKLVLQ